MTWGHLQVTSHTSLVIICWPLACHPGEPSWMGLDTAGSCEGGSAWTSSVRRPRAAAASAPSPCTGKAASRGAHGISSFLIYRSDSYYCINRPHSQARAFQSVTLMTLFISEQKSTQYMKSSVEKWDSARGGRKRGIFSYVKELQRPGFPRFCLFQQGESWAGCLPHSNPYLEADTFPLSKAVFTARLQKAWSLELEWHAKFIVSPQKRTSLGGGISLWSTHSLDPYIWKEV